MLKKLVTFSIVLFSLYSCHKSSSINDLPASNNPIFDVELTINNQPKKLVAGKNNCVLNTSIDTIRKAKVAVGSLTNGLSNFIIELTPSNIDISNELTFINKDYQLVQSNNFIELNKTSFINYNNISSIQWYDNGVFLGTDKAYLTEIGMHTICAQITFTDASSTEICNELQVGYKINSNFYIKAEFKSTYGQIEVGVEEISGDLEHVNWYINNQLVSDEKSFLLDLGSSACNLTAIATYHNGSTKNKTCYLNYKSASNSIEDFTNFELQNSNNVIQDNRFIVIYTENGETFRSDLIDNSSKQLSISSLENFGKSKNGNTIYKFNISGTILLKSTTTNTSFTTTINGVTGLEIK